jgi:hypothetical protein
MRWFPVLVYARKQVAAIRGLRHARGIKDFKNSGISRGGLIYTGGVRKSKTEIPAKIIDSGQVGKVEVLVK